ncbi:molybdate ABC transporter periplasmic substrate-binding protein [mine drainage metagenome]|uniref:Molybdate ABC transporter periplasmic substrate-binding protein n=1 Tax=mine drainage metagenome TaxID=410659 RepID=A0A1J5QZ01_9ZZZZ
MPRLSFPTFAVALCAMLALGAPPATRAAEPVLAVAYAGSMGAVMDRALGPAISRQAHVQFQGRGAGAFALAHLLADRRLRADVFVSITPGPIEVLRKAGLVDVAVPVASTQMVIAYSPDGPHAAAFRDAAAGRVAWYEVLRRPGLRFGRTDPTTDPQGRNIVFAMLLAQDYYHQPGLAAALLGDFQHNAAQIFAEPSLLSRLQSGQIDASSGYLSAVISHKLPYIKLPAQINLSDPAMQRDWYSRVHFSITGADGRPQQLSTQPLVFYAALLKNAADAQAGRAFIELMQGEQGRTMFAAYGYGAPLGGALR